MDTKNISTTSAQEARQVAEDARQKDWKQPSFLREMFLGNFQLDLLTNIAEPPARQEFVDFFDKIKSIMSRVNSEELERTREYPQWLMDELKSVGAFGMKIPKQYGGLGFAPSEYTEIIKYISSLDGSVAVLLSAHQSIGVCQPVLAFGSEYLKDKYLPRCASGAISAFALTEPGVGSDPSGLATSVERTPDGDFILNGEKIWCTNGPIAELLVVMARHTDTKKISAFLVESNWEGVKTTHRTKLMGLSAIQNGCLKFTSVKVPKENLIGMESKGLGLALHTLVQGRLALPAAAVGMSKKAISYAREWTSTRAQWGKPIVGHEAIAHKLSDMVVDTFGMECMSDLVSLLASDKQTDIRIEAAACKEWNTSLGWDILDDTLQIRGGRGYENSESLASRGEIPMPIERMLRDARINRIIEGCTEIMKLYLAREFVDKHLQVAGDIINPKATFWQKTKAFVKSGLFYSWWYPYQYIPKINKQWLTNKYYRYLETTSRKLARQAFHGMIWYGAKLEHKQAYMFRLVDIGLTLFALSTALAKLSREEKSKTISHQQIVQMKNLLDMLYRKTKMQVNRSFFELWVNDDVAKYKLAQSIAKNDYLWIENY